MRQNREQRKMLAMNGKYGARQKLDYGWERWKCSIKRKKANSTLDSPDNSRNKNDVIADQ